MIKFIDLFAGAGGLSEGFIRQGFEPIAHVEMVKAACMTLETRAAYHYLVAQGQEETYYNYLSGLISQDQFSSLIPDSIKKSVINSEISELSIPTIFDRIDELLENDSVDIIIGGPPCQAYSIVGRARDPHKMLNDRRNYLYIHYVEFLKKYKPKVFVFENVPGLLSAKNGEHFTNIKEAINNAGYEFHYRILEANNYGVLQNRKRVVIIGWRSEFDFSYPEIPIISNNYQINDILYDLASLKPGEKQSISYYTQPINEYLKQSKIRTEINFTVQHEVRPHNPRDLEIYRIAIDHWLKNKKRLNYSELPEHLKTHKNQTAFLNRFQVVDPFGCSHTVVAHISCDGHYYIYPDLNQVRSISIREAARIQSFPDNYYFEGGRTAAFKQIGNAVPPLMAEAIAKQIKEMLTNE